MATSEKNTRGLSIETIYREQRTQLGRMNDTIYRFPPFFATVIGGLWYFAAQYLEKDRNISAGVFIFAAVCAGTAFFALRRYALVLLAFIHSIENLEGRFKPSIPVTRFRTIPILMVLVATACVLSILGAAYALVGG